MIDNTNDNNANNIFSAAGDSAANAFSAAGDAANTASTNAASNAGALFGALAGQAAEDAGVTQEYTIESGDTLSEIGQRHGISWNEIYEANRDTISDPDKIQVGQRIKIPAKNS